MENRSASQADKRGLSSLPVSSSPLYRFVVVTEEIVGILIVNLGRFSVFCVLIEHPQHSFMQREQARKGCFNLFFRSYKLICKKEQNSQNSARGRVF